MKIVTVIGARPQFVKAAVVSAALRRHRGLTEIVVHTGQHFDDNMSGVFFTELGIAPPAYHFAIHGGTHGAMTGQMLIEIERVLLAERPDVVMVYGDTNSTLAGALAAVKLEIPVAHVEAGLRSFNMAMPEEVNRIVADRVARWLFTPTTTAVRNLEREGVPGAHIVPVGDVMYDAALHYAARAAEGDGVVGTLRLAPREYVLATVHRAENTDDPARLGRIVEALERLSHDVRVVWPVHPRTRAALGAGAVSRGARLTLIDPVGYLDMVRLERHAALIATDSGGVQKEAFFYEVPCVTLRDETEWVELIETGWNRLAPPTDSESVYAALRAAISTRGTAAAPYGDGTAAMKIADHLASAWNSTMRITYLHQYFNTPDMAGGTRSYEMARRLVAAGHEVNMITTWREPTERRGWFTTYEAGINVHWLPVPYSNHMGFAKRLWAFQKFAAAASRKASALPADVIFATSTPLTIAIPGIIASRARRIPLVFEVRDLWPDVPVAMGVLRNPVAVAGAYALERLAYRSAAAIVVVAPGMKPAIMTRGIAPERIEVIPNGCDFSVFDNAAAAVDLSRGAGKTILYLGTMGLANGVEYIPRLASEIGKAHPDVRVRFVLIGDGARRNAAETLAKQLDVWGSTVTFVGSMPKREVARWLAAADATIITYDGPEIVYRDSVSNKFFDSITAGKPVLANYSGYATVTAAEAGAGFIIDKDPAVAAGQVSRLFADPGALLEAGNKARQLARERFDRDMLAQKLEVLLRDVVRRASSPGSA